MTRTGAAIPFHLQHRQFSFPPAAPQAHRSPVQSSATTTLPAVEHGRAGPCVHDLIAANPLQAELRRFAHSITLGR